jgi:hypothetical protein
MISPSDLLASALAIWASGGFGGRVPGGLQTGRLVPPLPEPYAQLAVKSQRNHWYTEAPIIAWEEWLVTIDILGVGEQTVGALVNLVQPVFQTATWSIAGAVWQHTYVADGYPLLEEEKREDLRQGEDYWRARLGFDVAGSSNS